MKNENQWIDEAKSFKDEFFNATGLYPKLDNVISECMEIAKDSDLKETMEALFGSVENYAEELYSYMQ